MEIKDSQAIKVIYSEIGEFNEAIFLPPLFAILPFAFVYWIIRMIWPVSPIVTNEVLQNAQYYENEEILNIISKRNGKLIGFDLWQLRHKLRRVSSKRAEQFALESMKKVKR